MNHDPEKDIEDARDILDEIRKARGEEPCATKLYQGTCTPGDMNWQVTVDGRPLPQRQDLRNHSPDGFSWGY
jgi:hypothetical protein